MSAEPHSSKRLTAPVLKWQLTHEETDDDCNSQSELNQRIQGNDHVTYSSASERDSDSTLSVDEFLTDVIPASFSNLNTTTGNIGVLQNAYRPRNTELLEEVESISSDLTDSLIISPKTKCVNNSQEIEFQSQKLESQEIYTRSKKRILNSRNFFLKRRKIDESRELNCNQSIKENYKVYDTDELLRKLKHPDELSLKDRKRATSRVRQALTEIRDETESMLRGLAPVPNKMHIKMQLMRSRKLCDHLIALYEEFPSNSQKMLLEEVSQVRETIQCELKGILELLNYSKTSPKRLVHQSNSIIFTDSNITETYPNTSVKRKFYQNDIHEEEDHGENDENTLLDNLTYTTLPESFDFGKQNLQNESEKNVSKAKEDSSIEMIDLASSPLHNENQANTKLLTDANKKIHKNSSQFKKRVHFNLEPDILQMNETTKYDSSALQCSQQFQNQKLCTTNTDSQVTQIFDVPAATVCNEISTQSNIIDYQAKLQNTSKITCSNNQNSFNYSVVIPGDSLNIKSPEKIFIPLHQGNLPNSSLLESENSPVNCPEVKENCNNTSSSIKPVYVFIVKGNENQNIASSSSGKFFSYFGQQKEDLQNSHTMPTSLSQEDSHTCQSTSLFNHSQTSQIAISKNSDESRIFKQHNNVEHTLVNPHSHILMSEALINKNQETLSPCVTSIKAFQEPKHSSQVKSPHLDDINKTNINIGNKTSHHDISLPGKEQECSNFNPVCIIQNSSNMLQHLTSASILTQQTTNNNAGNYAIPSSSSLSMHHSEDVSLLEHNFTQTLHANVHDSPSSRQSQSTDNSKRTANVHSLVSNSNYRMSPKEVEADSLHNIRITDEIKSSNTAAQTFIEQLPTRQLQNCPQKSRLQKIHKPLHSGHATSVTSPTSLNQPDAWIHIKPPKLPWQTGEIVSDSQIPDFPELPCPHLQSLNEFKKFKIPKLPWKEPK